MPPGAVMRDDAWLKERLEQCTRLTPAPVGRGKAAVQLNATEARRYEREVAPLNTVRQRLVVGDYAI